MNTSDLQNLLARGGFQGRVQGSEVLIQECWFCGNDAWNLELNPNKGVYSCWACKASGRLDTLLRKYLGTDTEIPVQLDDDGRSRTEAPKDFPSRPADEVPSAVAYLRRRGYPASVCRAYGLRVGTAQGHRFYARLCVPMRDFWTGDVVGWTARTYIGQHPKYLTSGRFGLTGYRTRAPRPVLLVEGPFDGISVHRAGYQAAVLGGTGTRGYAEQLADDLDPKIPLGVLFDGDAHERAEKVWWKIRERRPDAALFQLPNGADPGDLAPEALSTFISANGGQSYL